jgi:hypothetical protein
MTSPQMTQNVRVSPLALLLVNGPGVSMTQVQHALPACLTLVSLDMGYDHLICFTLGSAGHEGVTMSVAVQIVFERHSGIIPIIKI